MYGGLAYGWGYYGDTASSGATPVSTQTFGVNRPTPKTPTFDASKVSNA